MAELEIRLVSDLQEALDASDVRNTGREFMTHDQHKITHTDQTQWYYGQYNRQNRNGNLYLFVGYLANEPVAYGLVRYLRRDYWLTGVISSKYRGQGYGKQLFEYLSNYVLDELDHVVSLDVKETNMPARKLYESLGYQYVRPNHRQNGVLVMRKAKDHARKA